MTEAKLEDGFADPSRDAAFAFRAALRAMSRPGTIVTFAGSSAPGAVSDAAAGLILTLCDPTTPIFLATPIDSDPLRDWISFHTGAAFVGPERCMFGIGAWEDLKPLDRFDLGTSEYPDRAATLIVEVPNLAPSGAVLAGPGIKDTARLNLPEVEAFQRNQRAFPLGLDFFFTCEDQVAGVPRSTKVAEG